MDKGKQAIAAAVFSLYHQYRITLATNPENIIKYAKDGDYTCCVAIMEATRDQSLPPSHVVETLEMFIYHIVKSCPLDKASSDQTQLSEVSYIGLSFILLLYIDEEEDPRLRPLQDALPKILEWNMDRYVNKSAPEKNLIDEGYRDKKSLAMFFDAIHHALRRNLNKHVKPILLDPRWLDLAMVIWLDPDTSPSWKLTQMGHFTRFIDDAVIYYSNGQEALITPAFGKALDVMQAAAHGDPEVLIEPCLKLLIKQTSALHCESSVINGAAETLGKFCAVPNHPVTRTVYEKGSLAVATALARVTDPSPPKGNGSLSDAFNILVSIVSSFSKPGNGPTWLLRALQAGLLAHIAPRSSMLSTDYPIRVTLINNLFSKNLPAHLSNPSVIFATENALSELSAGDHDQIMKTVFADSWKFFIHRFFEQYVYYCYFEVAGTRKGCYKCGKPESGDKASALKRCARCKVVEYCTSACQSTDWAEHKLNCKLLRDKKHGPPTSWSLAPFRRRLEAYDVRRHLPGISALAQQRYPGYPLQNISINLNYGIFPPHLFVALETETPVSHELLESQASDPMVREPCFDDVRLHDGSSGILCAVKQEDGEVTLAFQRFHWSMPYFCSGYGTQCSDSHERKSLATAYVGDDGNNVATTWSVVDEIAYRAKLSPKTIMDGNIGEIRRKVIDVVTKEKARMHLSGPRTPTAPTKSSPSEFNRPPDPASVFDDMKTTFLQCVTDSESLKSMTETAGFIPLVKSFPMDPELIRHREKSRYDEHLSIFNSVLAPWDEVREHGEKIWFLNLEGRDLKSTVALKEAKPSLHDHVLVRWPETRWDDLVFPVSDTEGEDSDSDSTIDGGDY